MTKSFDAICWNPGPHLRVYSSSGSVITERCYDDDSWFTGGFRGVGKAVGATACIDGNHVEFVKAYTIDSNNNITEQSWDGYGRQWTPGAFQAMGIDLSAVSWLGSERSQRIRVYVVNPDHTVTEHCWSGDKWYTGDFVAENAAGVEATMILVQETGYEATPLAPNLRIYIRGLDNKITEYYYDDHKWKKGGFQAEGVKDISVASYVKGSTHIHLRAYTISNDRKLTEHCWDGDEWYTGDLWLNDVDLVSATAWTKKGADRFDTEHTHLRVYTKSSDNRVVERYWDGDWEDGEYTPA